MFKKIKQSSLILSIILILVLTLFLVFIIFSLFFDKDDFLFSKNEKLILFSEQIDISLPIRFRIPKINVDTYIEHVGLTLTGAMDVPKNPNNVAWFDLGIIPGEIGSAVMAGHYGWKDNIPAVFDDLNKLQIGDKIYLENEKGETVIFVVRQIKTYKENANATDVFSSNDGKSHLNLVTCEGIWNEAKKSRPNRLVVFTDRE